MSKVPVHAVESISFNAAWKNTGVTPPRNTNGATGTPRPLPQARFFQEQQSFSTKKEKAATPRDALPPRPPVKSAPPVSRIFPQSHRQIHKAQPVNFKEISNTAIVSPHYNEGSKELYFDQCFEIECRLGAGSFGEVFKVRSREDGKFYAIKRSRERFRGECDRKRKLEEVAKHQKLRHHPNCVHFYKAWEEKEHLYIQTELCAASLNGLADKNHNIPERVIKNYIVDLLMAVKHLHDSDLVHMDIKPENIFISSDSSVCKLGDFGLVIDLSKELDYSEAQEGDPKYLAPELLQGKFGKPADVFSLGITMLELASDLDLPRGGELWHQLRQKNVPEHLLHDMSPDLRWAILAMLEPDPSLRPTVDKLLQEPRIKKIWRQRRKEQIIRKLSTAVFGVFQLIWYLLRTLWLTITHPLHSVLPTNLGTPRKGDGPAHPPDWDHSFSEDEVGHDDSISMNNSLCAPLDFSTSSEDSHLEESVGVSKLFSWSSPRFNSFRKRSSRGGAESCPRSPNATAEALAMSVFSSSPFSSPRPTQLEGVSSCTPHTTGSSCQRSLLEDLDQPPLGGLSDCGKGAIEPKNLMDAFDGASSDEDL